jgi:hypothetical protein
VANTAEAASGRSGFVRITGGGSIPTSNRCLLNASYPLVVSELDEEGFRLRMRNSRLDRIRLPMLPASAREATCHYAWSEIVRVDKGPRSVVVWTADSSCRFAVGRPSRLRPILDAARTHDIEVHRVRWTLTWWFHRSSTWR